MPAPSLNVSSIARLPQEKIRTVLKSLTDEECEQLLHDWTFLARPEQLPPDSNWQTWLVLAGRGFGKTRTGAEWVRAQVKSGLKRIHLIAPTASDARDVMVEGESGLLSVCWAGDKDCHGNEMGRPTYEPSKRRVTWANGAVATTFSAEEPERLRGPQCEAIWADELGAWKYLADTWNMATFGNRLGPNPRTCVTTTPKPLKILRDLASHPRTIITGGSTYDNAANLASTFLDKIRADYEGTRLGRQEIYADLLDEAEGALWTRDMVEKAHYRGEMPDMKRVVIAIDPAITAKEESDETGIIACGLGVDNLGYVLRDLSGRYSPDGWARQAITLAKELKADRIVAEGNQGGDMVRHTIETQWRNAPITIVHASRGKAARAEPVAALYEQGRIRHMGGFPDLEDQLVTWEPLSGMPSPDRLDALVWGFTELIIRGGMPEPVFATYGNA